MSDNNFVTIMPINEAYSIDYVQIDKTKIFSLTSTQVIFHTELGLSAADATVIKMVDGTEHTVINPLADIRAYLDAETK